MNATDPSRLTAILAADAAGYSRLMAANERATMAALDAGRAVFRTKIEANQGRVIDMAGDSVLAVFQTAAGAVSAALAIQNELHATSSLEPEERRMRFRIGVHLGDVIEKSDGSVYGDGVNIAARLQAKAPPGGVCLSQTVYDTVKGKLPMRARFIGPETFKNIAEPVLIWQVLPENAPEVVAEPAKVVPRPEPPAGPTRRSLQWIAGGAVAIVLLAIAGGWYWMRPPVPAATVTAKTEAASTDAKSIAVLPFANMSDDKSTAYFADGVHEDLLTQLALLGDLKVVSRTTVMEYRETKKNMRQIGTELGVGALVEGSVRRAGNQVRVTAQLVDARTDKHLWAKSYDRELTDIFAIQSELATEIAKALKVSLAPQEQTRLAKKPTDNLEAYDLFLRAQELLNQTQGTMRSVATIKDRVALLAKAVQLDPNFSQAWARLAAEHGRAYWAAIDKTPARQAQARAAMDRALALAPEDLLIKIAEGEFYSLTYGNYEGAAQVYEKVLTAAPHNVEALNGLATVCLYQGRVAQRVALIERALEVEPRNFGALNRLRNHYGDYRQYDRALAYQEKLIEIRPEDLDLQAVYHLFDYYRTGDWVAYDKWRSTLPNGAERKYSQVHHMDLNRAIARRDYARVLSLAELDPDYVNGRMDASQSEIIKTSLRAYTYLAKGDRSRASESARTGLHLVEAEIRNRPKDAGSWMLKSWLHAVLGERDLALRAHSRAVAVAKEEGGAFDEEWTERNRLGLYALLGDRKEALAEASRQLKLPGVHVREFMLSIELADLWDDPQFKVLVDDPKNSAPLSIVNQHPLR